jgi:hypothetical protein
MDTNNVYCACKISRVHHDHIMMQIIKSLESYQILFSTYNGYQDRHTGNLVEHTVLVLRETLYSRWHTVKDILDNDLAKSDNTHINITQPELRFLDEELNVYS